MKLFFAGGVMLVIGILLGHELDLSEYTLFKHLNRVFADLDGGGESKPTQSKGAEKEILYWVAPMDPNYRRDKPGQSPMGMDLIPVYAGNESGGDDSDVVISPAVVNNLGVRTAVAKHQDLERRIDTVGYVSFDESKISHIHLRTDGWVERLLVKFAGEHIEKGQLLFQFYSPTLVNAQEEFLQAIASRNARLVSASERRLLALGMTKRQMERVQKSGKAHTLVSVYAPQHGIISRLAIREGMRVGPEMSLMTLANLHSVWLQTAVFERQADWVTIGGRAEARLSYLPGKIWKGKVDFIYPTLDPKTRTLKVRLKFENPNKQMKPNMYAKTSIFGLPRKNILTIPREAVIRSGRGERVILALGEGRFNGQPIRTGMESGGLVEVLSGLKAGDKVVTSAQFLIDSQASLKGSLDRMADIQPEKTDKTAAIETIESQGILRETMGDERKVKVSHKPIAALKWPAMTMDFPLAEGVSLPDWPADTKIHFSLRRLDEFQFEIIQIRKISGKVPAYKATGILRKVLGDENKVKITHDPIPALKWPTMTMDFALVADVAPITIQPGKKVSFLLQKVGEFDYQVTKIQAIEVEAGQ